MYSEQEIEMILKGLLKTVSDLQNRVNELEHNNKIVKQEDEDESVVPYVPSQGFSISGEKSVGASRVSSYIALNTYSANERKVFWEIFEKNLIETYGNRYTLNYIMKRKTENGVFDEIKSFASINNNKVFAPNGMFVEFSTRNLKVTLSLVITITSRHVSRGKIAGRILNDKGILKERYGVEVDQVNGRNQTTCKISQTYYLKDLGFYNLSLDAYEAVSKLVITDIPKFVEIALHYGQEESGRNIFFKTIQN